MSTIQKYNVHTITKLIKTLSLQAFKDGNKIIL